LEQTSKLNDAYRTLRDPILRTEYLLKIEGLKVQEQSTAATEAARLSGQVKKSAVPPDLLEQVFELNMQLEELRANKNLGDEDYALVRELEQAQHNFEYKLNSLQDELHALWNEWDALMDEEKANVASDERRAVCLKLLELLNRRRYVRHLVSEIGDALNE
jgi:molecular chaperone HscB